MAKNTPSDKSSSHPHPSGSRRQQLAAQAAQAERDRRIRRRVGLTLTLAIVAAVVFAGAWVGKSYVASRPSADAASGEDAYTIEVGQATAPVSVEVYQDFMCPYCGRFENANGGQLAQLVEDGTVHLTFHPMSFLDSTSQGSEYSTRSANAFVTAAKADPEHTLALNAALYANQPAEGTAGLTDGQIAQIALGVGVDQTVVDTFADRTYEQWLRNGTKADFAAGITGTPTVKINGQTYDGDLYTPGPLKAAIDAAADE
ncbi:Protein-disulfide isomerase [Raineyella antarctica]|uniref:Protein-disulfide isomerase n=1 Tax=Raineyella antarctica TaxID=1577474 RepID=A0A1G6HHG7_9ACTN|nr:thioredoxin domain-containing protein [Raineyella antarctica]SDB93624.1 Protein-disulfide isomerase [Raineyella antarctica]